MCCVNSARKSNGGRIYRAKLFVNTCPQIFFGAFSVSQSMADAVKQFIASQREHHQGLSFEDEYLRMLRLHGIAFDEQYVFEQAIVA